MNIIGLVAAVSAVGMLSFGSSLEAASIINRDGQAHVLRIIEGDDQREVSLEPQEQADGLCSSTCNMVVDDGPDSFEIAANDGLAIEDGVVLVADEPATDEPATDEPATDEPATDEPATDDSDQ